MYKSKKDRQKEAQVRQDAHNRLTPLQKINKLDSKFGIGIGAKKERAKLQAEL
ncbi:MAG: hypothetical protein KAR40_11355 [Candidatus Sabulitectum sp.]|nr:hypothetical protein [Candidatus Sabulitectum sp.]